MQTNKDDSAFPIFDSDGTHFTKYRGLSKREFFAALALQGILANPSLNVEEFSFNLSACLAIESADVLIRKLNRPDPYQSGDY